MITVNKRHTLPWTEGMTTPRRPDRDALHPFPHIVVAVNGTLVRHNTYDTTTIPDGADVRVVHLMAGG